MENESEDEKEDEQEIEKEKEREKERERERQREKQKEMEKETEKEKDEEREKEKDKEKVKEKDKKKKYKKGKLVKKSEVELVPELSVFESKFELEGIQKLVLSTITQKSIGCVVGENITTEEPWVFITKEKIEDNLELHEESSEFLPIKQLIMAYPEEEMLLGFDKPIEDDMQEFFICANIAAKDNVLSIIQTQRDEMQERLKQSVCKCPREWNSLGSEGEVDENILHNLRPLIEIELDSKYPLYSEKKKFKLRLAEDAIDGYIEILPGRFPITNVYRKRVDAGVQITPPTINNEAQTNPTYPKNAWTQYKYEYDEPKLNAASIKHLIEFMYLQAERLSDTIHVNEYINLYTNDYTKMAKEVNRSSVIVNRDIISFRDVLACKGLKVSDIALNPMMSGVLAAAYTKAPFNWIFYSPNREDVVDETTFGNHFVLIWCNTDTLTPKLYLHSYREVNKLRYCPFKHDILVGGCTNGQIVVWDLSGRLKKVETREILTPDEQKHRLIMWSLMGWMKNTHNISVVLPTVISSLDFCHNNVVTHVSWLLPNYEVTRNGKLQECEEDTTSMQFLSCGLDGRILIWDLLKKPHGVVAARSKKSQRLEKRPSALTMDISEYRDLNNVLMPQYKLNVKNPSTTMPYPLTCIEIRNKNFTYAALNPETEEDCFQRTYFEPVKSEKPYEFEPELAVGDKLGNFFYCTFEGHDFDQGQSVNYENMKYTEFMLVHDGPIRACVSSAIDENILLTVGGRVFAIWDRLRPIRPMFWRKSKYKYVNGIWSAQQAGEVIIARADSYVETWELLVRTKSPGQLIRMSGSSVLDQFSDNTKNHVKKMTLVTTDVVGAVRVYRSTKTKNPQSIETVRYALKIRHRILQRKEKFTEWVKSWREIHGRGNVEAEEAEEKDLAREAPKEEEKGEEEGEEQEKDTEKQPEKKAEPPARDSETPTPPGKKVFDTLTGTSKWQEKQEKIMYEILLEKKKLNLAEIEQHKIPLQKLITEQQHKSVKIEEILEKKEQIFEAATKMIFKEKKIKKRKKFRITFPNEITEIMKQTYIAEYNDAIEDTLKYIKTHPFRYFFDWSTMIKQGKQRRKSYADKEKKDASRKQHSTFKDRSSTIAFADMKVSKMDISKIKVTASAIEYTQV